MIKNSYGELIGNTPMLRLNNIISKYNLKCDLLAKLEYFNPAGSIKDRVGKALIDDALNKGIINLDTTIIEPTSGNTGIGLAAYAASLKMKVIIVMPENMSEERKMLMKAYNASLVLTPASLGMKGAILKAEELAKDIQNSYIPRQFDNESNPLIHYKTTGVEIYNDTLGKVDVFVAGIGTGGTISGVGKYLKEQNKDIYIVGVEPHSSPLLTQNYAGPHKIQGIGANFVPNNYNHSIVDEVIDIKDDEAFKYSRLLVQNEGVFAGISAGAALCAAIKLAKSGMYDGKTIVVLLADGGDRYLSTELVL